MTRRAHSMRSKAPVDTAVLIVKIEAMPTSVKMMPKEQQRLIDWLRNDNLSSLVEMNELSRPSFAGKNTFV